MPGGTGTFLASRRFQVALIRPVARPVTLRTGLVPQAEVAVIVQRWVVGMVPVTVTPEPVTGTAAADAAGDTRPGAIRAVSSRRSHGSCAHSASPGHSVRPTSRWEEIA